MVRENEFRLHCDFAATAASQWHLALAILSMTGCTLLELNMLIRSLVFALFACVSLLHGDERPNVLIIMADDCTYNDLSLYGGQNAKTPNIDRLAAQGLTFNRAYLASAMCQPCRAELYTGQYPLSNGCAWNHSASHPGTKSLPHHLGSLGYRVGIAGKVHVKPAKAFPFENVDGFEPNCVRNPTRECRVNPTKEFFTRDELEPFCLVVALVEPHLPWVMGDPSQYPTDKLMLPANIADTPETREDFSKYLAEITYMDGQVGQILNVLEESGHSDDTLVLFTSEQGSQFPGNKWTTWNTGVHTALVARWPGRVPEGKRTDALVQYADVVPTLVDLTGGEAGESDFDGTSFAGVLLGTADTHRDYVYACHNNVPEGPAYPTRAVSDGQWRYVRNLTPDRLYIEKHLMGHQGGGKLNNPYWNTWVWASASDENAYALVERYQSRPPEALYHTRVDPHELVNLVGDSNCSAIKEQLSAELDRWLAEQGDPGIPQDSNEALQAARKGNHLYRPAAN